MKPKTIKIIYWSQNILFVLAMTMDAIGGLSQNEEGQKALTQLHYPLYLMPILGMAKLLGVVALLQPWFNTIKEWAYAGFAFNFIGASLSWTCIQGPIGFVVLPIVVLAVMMLGYYFWKKHEKLKTGLQ